jgi:hypothetical protein
VLIENEYRIRKELEEIETKRRLLETKLDTNLKQRQRTDPEAEELIRELMAMERSRSYPICEAMQQYLPRELRDMIYKHVIGPAEWHNNNHTVPILESNNPARPYVVLTGSMQDLWGILRRDGYITHQTRRELLECWYKTCTFDFATDVHLIRAFFERDAALYRFLELGLPALNLVCQLEIDVPRDVLMDEARFNETLGRTLRDLALLKRPARLRLNLDTYFKISTPPKAYEPSRFKYLGEPDPIARGEVFKKLSQLLPSLTGWKIELVVEVWTLPQKHNMENIIGHGKLGDDLCSGFEVQMMLPGLAEFSHSQWECLFHKVRHDLAVSQSTSLTLLLSFVVSSTSIMTIH